MYRHPWTPRRHTAPVRHRHLRAACANGHSFSELSAEFARPRARANYDLLRPVDNPVRTFDADSPSLSTRTISVFSTINAPSRAAARPNVGATRRGLA